MGLIARQVDAAGADLILCHTEVQQFLPAGFLQAGALHPVVAVEVLADVQRQFQALASLQGQRGGVPLHEAWGALILLSQHIAQFGTVTDQVRNVIAILDHQVPRFGQDAHSIYQGALVPAADTQLPQGQCLLCGTLVAVFIQPRKAKPHTLRHSGGGQLYLDAPPVVSGQGRPGLVDRLGGRIRVLNVTAPDEQAGMFLLVLPPHRFQVREGQGVHWHPGVVEQVPPAQCLIAARVQEHPVFVQGLELVDGLGCVLGRVGLGCGGQDDALPDA